MTAVVTEVHGERDLQGETDSTKDKSSIGYMVYDETDEYLAYAAVQAAAPAMAGVLIRDSIKLKHIEIGIWEATVSYVAIEQQKKDPDIGEIEWDFDDTGGTQHITSGIAPTVLYPVPNWNPMEFQRAINVSKTKTGWQVKGIEVAVAKGQVTATTSFAPGTVTPLWRQQIKKFINKTNNAKWKEWEAGELKFLGMRIKKKYREKETVVFNFLEAANITAQDNVTVGGDAQGNGACPPIVMTGHQVMWVYFVQEEDNNQVLMKAKQANVDTVCLSAAFDQLGLGN